MLVPRENKSFYYGLGIPETKHFDQEINCTVMLSVLVGEAKVWSSLTLYTLTALIFEHESTRQGLS